MKPVRATYALVRESTPDACAFGLQRGDVLVTYGDGTTTVLRAIANGPPLGFLARIAQAGTLQPLDPTGT